MSNHNCHWPRSRLIQCLIFYDLFGLERTKKRKGLCSKRRKTKNRKIARFYFAAKQTIVTRDWRFNPYSLCTANERTINMFRFGNYQDLLQGEGLLLILGGMNGQQLLPYHTKALCKMKGVCIYIKVRTKKS